MYNCPKCKSLIKSPGQHRCPECETNIVFCQICQLFSEVDYLQNVDILEHFSICHLCNVEIFRPLHIYKSTIYHHFNYAFKFVNRAHIPYPYYFRDGPIFGIIQDDIGDYNNDFCYVGGDPTTHFKMMDYGTTRAYRIELFLNNSIQKCIALSHETGFEVFLIAPGTFLGLDTSKFVLKKTLANIEKLINHWWNKRKKYHQNEDNVNEPLIVAIQIRTPNWEITIDYKFSQEEKDKIYNTIQNIGKPPIDILDFANSLHDEDLAKKVKESTRNVVRHLKEEF